MAIQDLKFKESDFVGKDVSSLPDQIEGQAEFVKARIDNVPKNMIALGKFNDLIDELGANNNGVNAEKLGGKSAEDYAPASAVAPVQAQPIISYAPNISGQGASYAWDDGKTIHIVFYALFSPGGDGIPSGGVIANIQGVVQVPVKEVYATCSVGYANNTWGMGNCTVTTQGEIMITSGNQTLFMRALGEIFYPKKTLGGH